MYCKHCGRAIDDEKKICPYCKSKIKGDFSDKYSEFVDEFKNTENVTENFDTADIAGNKFMCVLAYIGVLVFIPMFAKKDSKYVRFHANQGLVLLIFEVAYAVLRRMVVAVLALFIPHVALLLNTILGFIEYLFLVYIVLGLINVANGVAKKLPIIGKITILK
ncbi:MAG: hypothetical protein ACI4QE_04235 [Acutalibacteraceae bacterium]